jgi:hypothetical protein
VLPTNDRDGIAAFRLGAAKRAPLVVQNDSGRFVVASTEIQPRFAGKGCLSSRIPIVRPSGGSNELDSTLSGKRVGEEGQLDAGWRRRELHAGALVVLDDATLSRNE